MTDERIHCSCCRASPEARTDADSGSRGISLMRVRRVLAWRWLVRFARAMYTGPSLSFSSFFFFLCFHRHTSRTFNKIEITKYRNYRSLDELFDDAATTLNVSDSLPPLKRLLRCDCLFGYSVTTLVYFRRIAGIVWMRADGNLIQVRNASMVENPSIERNIGKSRANSVAVLQRRSF